MRLGLFASSSMYTRPSRCLDVSIFECWVLVRLVRSNATAGNDFQHTKRLEFHCHQDRQETSEI